MARHVARCWGQCTRGTWHGRGEAASVQHLQVPSVAAADVGVNRGPAVVHLVELLTGLREIYNARKTLCFVAKTLKATHQLYS